MSPRPASVFSLRPAVATVCALTALAALGAPAAVVAQAPPAEPSEADKDALRDRAAEAEKELDKQVGPPPGEEAAGAKGSDKKPPSAKTAPPPAAKPGSPPTDEPPAAPERAPAFEKADVYATASERVLMLQGKLSSRLDVARLGKLYKGMGFGRFEQRTWAVGSPELAAWCKRAAADMQVKRGDIDEETGEANLTMDAVLERCSEVYQHDLTVKHGCKRVAGRERTVNGKKQKTKPKMQCHVSVTLTFRRFAASYDEAGNLRFAADKSYRPKTLKGSATRSDEIDDNTPPVKAKRNALSSAISGTSSSIQRRLLGMREFQNHAPLVRASKGTADFCLSRTTVSLDQPFHIVVKTKGGEKRVGFVKAREIYDGCDMTPSLEEQRKKGRKVVIKPLRAETILGGSSVKRGMTAWEMATIGLNVGFAYGYSPLYGGERVNSFGVDLELNTAPATGSSELHFFLHARLSGTDDTEDLDALFGKAYPLFDTSLLPGSAAVIMAEMGLLKRYYGGPAFFEWGAGFASSFYLLDTYEVGDPDDPDDVRLGIAGLGGKALVGVGLQLSPRWLFRVQGAYRFMGMLPFVMVNGESCEDAGYTGCAEAEETDREAGWLATATLMFTL